jgi:hypothetical protein
MYLGSACGDSFVVNTEDADHMGTREIGGTTMKYDAKTLKPDLSLLNAAGLGKQRRINQSESGTSRSPGRSCSAGCEGRAQGGIVAREGYQERDQPNMGDNLRQDFDEDAETEDVMFKGIARSIRAYWNGRGTSVEMIISRVSITNLIGLAITAGVVKESVNREDTAFPVRQVEVTDWNDEGTDGPEASTTMGTCTDPRAAVSAPSIADYINPTLTIGYVNREATVRECMKRKCSLALTSPRLIARCACTPVARGAPLARTVAKRPTMRPSARMLVERTCSAPLRASGSENQGIEGMTTHFNVTTGNAVITMNVVRIKDVVSSQEARWDDEGLLDNAQVNHLGGNGKLHRLNAMDLVITAPQAPIKRGKETSYMDLRVGYYVPYKPPLSDKAAHPLRRSPAARRWRTVLRDRRLRTAAESPRAAAEVTQCPAWRAASSTRGTSSGPVGRRATLCLPRGLIAFARAERQAASKPP